MTTLTKKLEDVMPNEYNRILKLRGLELTDDVILDTMKVPVHAFSKYLGLKKNREDNGTSLILRNENGNFIIAGVVKYHAPEEEDQAGNWSYEFTFNEEDVKETHQYIVTDAAFMEVLQNVATSHNIAIKEMDFALDLIIAFFEAIKNLLDQNVTPTEEYEIESEGFFVATSAVEGDEKVFSIVPSGEMKRLIKDDSTLEG